MARIWYLRCHIHVRTLLAIPGRVSLRNNRAVICFVTKSARLRIFHSKKTRRLNSCILENNTKVITFGALLKEYSNCFQNQEEGYRLTLAFAKVSKLLLIPRSLRSPSSD